MFVALAIMGCAVLLLSYLPWRGNASLPQPRPDTIATSSAGQGNILIKNGSAGYSITVPETWYLEHGAGSGMTIYPDYDAALSAVSADCKIEIAVVADSAGADLSLWLTGYLHRDPTADIEEISRTAISVADAPAILWTGVLNGVLTTLAYVASGGRTYEIAPSIIAGAGSSSSLHGLCVDNLPVVLQNFTFIK